MLNVYIPYDMQYQGECGHIEGHAYSVLFVHLLDPRVSCIIILMSLIIASCTLENINS